MRIPPSLLFVALGWSLILPACGAEPKTQIDDGGGNTDAAAPREDAGVDAGADAGVDAGADAGVDGGADAGGDDGGGDEVPEETCDDGIQNQDETDVDCGGATCAACADGDSCRVAEDCMAEQCVEGVCFSGCISDEACAHLDDACVVGICNEGECEGAPANEGGECSTGDLCLIGMCSAGVCVGEPVDCSSLDDQCNAGVCNSEDGSCVAEPANEGLACDDGDVCSTAEVCTMGECIDPNGGTLFYEEFANNDAGWTLGPEWEIGPAARGCRDPSSDHTPSSNNGVAGVKIGRCAEEILHDDYCLTSPIIDTSGQASVWMTYYRHLFSDYTPYMKNKIEVYDGSSWVILFETGGSPQVEDSAWRYFGYDVSAHANENMQFRWCFQIGDSGVFQRGSWNIDDVTVAANECNVSDH